MGNAPTASRICIADGMRAEHANPKAFMAELVEVANAEWRRAGAGGVTLIFVEYEAGKALLDTGPGNRPLTVALVRAHLATKGKH